MSHHIGKTCSSAFYRIHNIRRISKYLNRSTIKTLIHALVTSRIDYCNSLLYGLPECEIRKLQRIQNAAARLVFQLPKYSQVTPLFLQLHWLPVRFRITFEIVLVTFKAVHGMAPPYLSSLVSWSSNNGWSPLILCICPQTSKSENTTNSWWQGFSGCRSKTLEPTAEIHTWN